MPYFDRVSHCSEVTSEKTHICNDGTQCVHFLSKLVNVSIPHLSVASTHKNIFCSKHEGPFKKFQDAFEL